ncbi:hypothetical protein RUM43_000327 [Polyplax serrata]|uniref:Uncharacterized protein n=1 Tax=Polyplax serrata TaxID=468196 RepID=A0AAN8SFK7_POLSC
MNELLSEIKLIYSLASPRAIVEQMRRACRAEVDFDGAWSRLVTDTSTRTTRYPEFQIVFNVCPVTARTQSVSDQFLSRVGREPGGMVKPQPCRRCREKSPNLSEAMRRPGITRHEANGVDDCN